MTGRATAGEFLGAGPAFELTFAQNGGSAVRDNLGVDHLDRGRIRRGLAAGTAAVLSQTPRYVMGGSDVEVAVLQARLKPELPGNSP